MSYDRLARLTAVNGYRPAQSIGGVDVDPNTLYRGQNYWVRPGGRLIPTKGAAETTAQNVGPRIYALDQYRGTIGGALVSSRLPKESLVRYQGSALFFVSENTSQQVYINESTSSPFTLTSVTTSSTASKLRVALLNGTTYTAYDAGLAAPLSPGTVATETGGDKSMDGVVSIVACARRSVTDYTSNPCPADVQTLAAAGNNRIRVTLPSMATGQDGWIYAGTNWGAGNYGPWKTIREIDTVFSVTCTNASASVTFANADKWLRPGDKITIVDSLAASSNYYVDGGADAPTSTGFKLASDATGTPTTFSGATGACTVTVTEIVLDWRNGELGEQIEFDNDLPPTLDGLMLFNNTPFGWQGNTLYPSKIGNPEAFPQILARGTQSGANIVQALAGDGRIYLMTTNGLEVVTFTQNDLDPFLIRQVWAFGFSSPTQAVVAEGTLYAAVGTSSGVKIVRTRVDDSPDLEFSANVESDMLGWNVANVTMAIDPANGAVLAIYNDGTNSKIVPFMLQQQVWGLPQTVTGQVKSAATVGNSCYFINLVSSNFRVYTHEGGTGSGTTSYVVWPFIEQDGIRQIIKRIKVTCDATTLYVYTLAPGASVPDVTNTTAATVSVALTDTLVQEPQIQTNLPNAQSWTIRIDSTGATAEITELNVFGMLNRIGR